MIYLKPKPILDCKNNTFLHSQFLIVNCKGLLLTDDNARPLIARVTQEKIMPLDMEVVPRSPYSFATDPYDSHLFM